MKQTKALPKGKKKKNPLKKFSNTLSFLILLALGGLIFYQGAVFLRIPEGHYALAFTKIWGYDRSLMEAGRFYWRWENLFPTNMTIHSFRLPWERAEVCLQGSLPSSREYAGMLPQALGGGEDGEVPANSEAFGFRADLSLRYRLNPERISDLISREDFRYEEIQEWYRRVPAALESMGAALMTESLLSASPEKRSPAEVEEALKAQLRERFPAILIEELTLLRWEIPDPLLYKEAREAYLAGISAARQRLSEMEERNVELQNRLTNKMTLLREYGELLTTYPVLLQYFNLDKEKIDPLITREEAPLPSAPAP